MRAEGFWGLSEFQDANEQFRLAVAQSPRNAMYRVRWGRLMKERFNNADATGLFNEALEIDPKNAQAYLGLAVVGAGSFDPKAVAVRRQGDRARSEAGGSARACWPICCSKIRRRKKRRHAPMKR